jgi:hypothetical protein
MSDMLRDRFLTIRRQFNDQHGPASREQTATLAAEVGYPSGRSVCYMFRHDWMFTRTDGRWVA